MMLRVWHLIAVLSVLVLVLGGAFAYMLGRTAASSHTRTVVNVVTVPQLAAAERARANASAESNVRSAIPAAEIFYQRSSSYRGLSLAKLEGVAPGISANVKAGSNAIGDGYCIQDSQGARTWHYTGGNDGGATIMAGACPGGYSVS